MQLLDLLGENCVNNMVWIITVLKDFSKQWLPRPHCLHKFGQEDQTVVQITSFRYHKMVCIHAFIMAGKCNDKV